MRHSIMGHAVVCVLSHVHSHRGELQGRTSPRAPDPRTEARYTSTITERDRESRQRKGTPRAPGRSTKDY